MKILVLSLTLFGLGALADSYVRLSVRDPRGLPDGWPVEERPAAGELPAGWVSMSPAELAAQKAARQAEFDSWALAYKTREARKLAVVTALESKIKSGTGLLKELKAEAWQFEALIRLWAWQKGAQGAVNSNRLDTLSAKMTRVLEWIDAAEAAIQNVQTNPAPVEPTLPNTEIP